MLSVDTMPVMRLRMFSCRSLESPFQEGRRERSCIQHGIKKIREAVRNGAQSRNMFGHKFLGHFIKKDVSWTTVEYNGKIIALYVN